MKKQLTDSERLSIVQEYLTSDTSKYAIAKKYGIERGSILQWIRKFGLEDKPQQAFMTRQKSTPTPQSDAEILAENKRLRQEIRQLKTRLAYEELGHKAYKELLEIAEETYDIEILKNSEAK